VLSWEDLENFLFSMKQIKLGQNLLSQIEKCWILSEKPSFCYFQKAVYGETNESKKTLKSSSLLKVGKGVGRKTSRGKKNAGGGGEKKKKTKKYNNKPLLGGGGGGGGNEKKDRKVALLSL